jgi:hypothetical protein
MLWYKSWLETRWRFVIGLVVLVCSGAGVVLWYPEVVKRLPLAATVDLNGFGGRQIREGAELAREYRGYVWWEWFRQSLRETWTIFAVLLGTGGLLSQTSGGAALFTLSMPVSRTRLLGVRAATGLAELLVLAIVPALVVPLFSPAIGQTYSAWDALVHGVCLFIAGTVFFSLAFLLSTVFSDVWRPAAITLALSYVLSFGEQASAGMSRFGILRIMSAQSYFRGGELPWFGLLAAMMASAAMLYAATVNIARRDF